MKMNLEAKGFALRGAAALLTMMLLLCACLPALATGGETIPATGMTLEEAKALALRTAEVAEADALLTKLAEDYDDGYLEFEIEFIAGNMEYDYEIDALTGTVLKSSAEVLSEREIALYAGTFITLDEAKAAALTKAGVAEADAVFTELQLDWDDGRMEYELEFTAGGEAHHVDMDAATGEVLRYETYQARGRR